MTMRRRLSTDVITSTRGIVIGLLLGLSLGLPTFAISLQGGIHRRGTQHRGASLMLVHVSRVPARPFRQGRSAIASSSIR